jgi:DNA polymerase I-like protein with 3'-5' exonuclease and polymerase domains
LADTGAQIIGRVHHEIILEVADKLANEAVAILKETMILTSESNAFRAFQSLPSSPSHVSRLG